MNIQKINSHPAYVESDEFREEVKTKQRIKGANKYPELFTPSSWTDDELAEHAMMEFHDGQEYVAGMRSRMREMREIINMQERKIERLEKLWEEEK